MVVAPMKRPLFLLASVLSCALWLSSCDDSTSSGQTDSITVGDADTIGFDLTTLTDITTPDAIDVDDTTQSDATQVDVTHPPDATDTTDVAVEVSDSPDVVDACLGLNCTAEQHCAVAANGTGSCVNNTCADLSCAATQRCELQSSGGALCVDVSCAEDLDCPLDEFCDGQACQSDLCQGGVTWCVGFDLHTCATNGSGEGPALPCGSPSPFPSTCQDPGNGQAYCDCEDDWDCPAYQSCNQGACGGAGAAPTCLLPPEPFSNVLPTNEIKWGADYPSVSATNAPFPSSTQSVIAPIVANLDDDNGDGLINELDFPEIIFLTFCGSAYTTNGVLRAIHGGGPNKGKDFFASAGTTYWHEGDPLNMAYTCNEAIIDATASIAVGDLDYDGIPEIVAIRETDGILVYDNTGELIENFNAATLGGANPSPSIANFDHQGFAEIAVGRDVFTLDYDTNQVLEIVDRLSGNRAVGSNGQGPSSCVGDIVGDDRLELVAGSSVYGFPKPPAGVTRRADCTGSETLPEELDFCAGRLVLVWDARPLNTAATREGFCAIADLLGADQTAAPSPANPLDGVPEVATITGGRLQVFNGQDGTLLRDINLNAGGGGGAPNVDDFDGDGFPEVGSAFASSYIMMDLQAASAACPAWPTVITDGLPFPVTNPARTPNGVDCVNDADCGAPGEAVCNSQVGVCTCLHNGWRRATEDDSSRVTGSTLFDFNGDGAAEVIYNDECWFRLYNGLDGEVLFKEPSESRTRIEYPIVADVDNDGNAEIVFTTSTESTFCSQRTASDGNGAQWRDHYNAGLEAWGDAGDFWVSARRIWNQHSYHVTNINEDGSVPMFEAHSWLPYNGRLYNTFRSQPRTSGIAPDLVVTDLQVSSPNAACGQLSDQVELVARIENHGDVRVGPGVVVHFEGTWLSPALVEWLNDASGTPLEFALQTSLEPGQALLVTVSYDAANNAPGTLPDSVKVVVDANNQERECNELNNELVVPVVAGSPEPDLKASLGAPNDSACPLSISIETTITNDGATEATDIAVRYYAGDPDQGGTVLHEETIPGPIPAAGSVTVTPSFPIPIGLTIDLYVVVDPDGAISECNDGNNKAVAPSEVRCDVN